MLLWSEILGFVAGALSVWLYARQNMWAWPTGIANSVFWLILFWDQRLFMDAGLQVVYIVLGVIGWYWWIRGRRDGDQRRGELPVTRIGALHATVLFVIAVVGTGIMWWAMDRIHDSAPLPDAATTVVSLIAQYLLTRKIWESWWCWITVDVAYVLLYISKHLYLTAALQPVFIIMCVIGLRGWQKSMAVRPMVDTPTPASAPAPVSGS